MRTIDLPAEVLASAQRRLPLDARVAVAFSGGIDSVVLLHVLASLRQSWPIELHGLHIHHGLSPNADRWETFCAHVCATLGVCFASARVHLGVAGDGGLEARARRARYAALESLARGVMTPVVTLGHHMDDQAETVALQLLRGASVRGLAAMSEWRTAEHISYWRPLLNVTRESIGAYAASHGLRWLDDESNSDVAIKRNFLRARVLPALEAGFADYRKTMSRAAARAGEAAELLAQLARMDARIAVTDEGLMVSALRSLGPLRATNLLQHVLRERGFGVPQHERLDEFVRQIIEAGNDRHPALRLDAVHSLRVDQRRAAVVAEARPFEMLWHHERVLELPHGRMTFERTIGAGLRSSRIPAGGLLVRPRAGGERLKLAADKPHRTLKNLMQEAAIPASLRAGWPMLADCCGVVAIPGIGVGVDWRCPSGEPGWLVEWRPSGFDCGHFQRPAR